MAPSNNPTTTVSRKRPADSPYQLDPDQTLKASRALLRHVQAETKRLRDTSSKADLLSTGASDSDNELSADSSDSIWLTLTTKQHIVDKLRLKPSRIPVPHSLNTSDDLRICIITTDPQRAIKNVVAEPSFPEDLKSRITRIISVTKLKARYKTFESRRQLLSEHDIFLADDRIITRLPALLGKVFYKSTSKRPIPIVVARSERTKSETNKKSSKDEGAKPPKSPENLAKEIEKAIDCVPVSLRPGTLLSARIGLATFKPEQLSENVSAVVQHVIEKHVVKGWRNVRGIHIKGHSTFAIPIWLADDLWTESKDITASQVDTAQQEPRNAEASPGQKRKRNPATLKGPQAGSRKKSKSDQVNDSKAEAEREMKESRKSKLKKQKAQAFSEAVEV
ncbi:hypothetical protein B0A52_08428 [Exophiala mesophila]|uniref:Ribosomal protein L1 n=1 Tax=Exophiala mesophila TaxID=212818 RepID=A0A438MW90_EXOME|nr:hypothetical protein B0A52_08428 [Exophiala mesophila]